MLRDNRTRARAARFVFILLAGVCALLLVQALLTPPLPTGAAITPESALRYGLLSLSGLLYLAVLTGSYIALIMWLRRAYYNLHQLPGIHPEYSDGWAAGAWFVPIIFWWRPYTITREVWTDTQLAAVGQVAEPATVLGWWWATYLLKFLMGRITWAMSRSSVGDFTQSDLTGIALDAGTQLLTALFTWYVIGRMARFEEQLSVRQQIDQLGQPAPAYEVPAALAAEQPNYGQPEGY